MPINIYIEESTEEIAWLCNGNWELASQINELENWLKENGINLPHKSYIADVGFEVRKNASGGGATLNSESLQIMGEIGMSLYLSEYRDDQNNNHK